MQFKVWSLGIVSTQRLIFRHRKSTEAYSFKEWMHVLVKIMSYEMMLIILQMFLEVWKSLCNLIKILDSYNSVRTTCIWKNAFRILLSNYVDFGGPDLLLCSVLRTHWFPKHCCTYAFFYSEWEAQSPPQNIKTDLSRWIWESGGWNQEADSYVAAREATCADKLKFHLKCLKLRRVRWWLVNSEGILDRRPKDKSASSLNYLYSVLIAFAHSVNQLVYLGKKTVKCVWARRRQRTRINIGAAFIRWKSLKMAKGFQSDAEVACFLLDR